MAKYTVELTPEEAKKVKLLALRTDRTIKAILEGWVKGNIANIKEGVLKHG